VEEGENKSGLKSDVARRMAVTLHTVFSPFERRAGAIFSETQRQCVRYVPVAGKGHAAPVTKFSSILCSGI
jgi:hypothetical protein